MDSAAPAMAMFLPVEIHAVGQGPHELVEHPSDDGTVALQVLDDLHPLEQLLAPRLQFADFLDPGVEYDDFLAQEVVAGVLVLDGRGEVLVAKEYQRSRCHQDAAKNHQELLLALLAQLFAPG